MAAARWNGHAAQATIGVVRTSWTHGPPVTWMPGTMARTTTGSGEDGRDDGAGLEDVGGGDVVGHRVARVVAASSSMTVAP